MWNTAVRPSVVMRVCTMSNGAFTALLGALAMPPSACGFGPWARAGAAAPASSAAASARVEGRGKKTGVVMAMLLVQG